MSKITSKYQVSIPKALAEKLGVRPGDDIEWRVAGDELRVTPTRGHNALPREKRLRMFDEATKRQTARDKQRRTGTGSSRGWKREDLYDRGRPR